MTKFSKQDRVARQCIVNAKVHLGYVTESDVKTLGDSPKYRLTRLLVKCGGARFVAPAQDIPTLIAAIESNGDYVRDVQIAI